MPITFAGKGTSGIGATVGSEPSPVQISALAESGVQATQVTITWTTDVIADSQVSYSTDHAYGTSTTLDGTMVTSHSVTITGLTANTQYFYVVKSQGVIGQVVTSSEDNFTTLAAATCGPPTYGCFITNTTVIADPTYASFPSAGGNFSAADGFSTPAATIIRVSDDTTCPGIGTNHWWGSSAEANVFNQDSTRFMTATDHSGLIPWTLNVSTRAVARVAYVAGLGRTGTNACEAGTPNNLEVTTAGASARGTWGYAVANKDVYFLMRQVSATAKLQKLDFNNLAAGWQTIKQLDAISGLPASLDQSAQDITISGDDAYVAWAGIGTPTDIQNNWQYVVVVRLSDGLGRWMRFTDNTVGGDFGPTGAISYSPTSTTGCKIHNVRMDKTGKYVEITVVQGTCSSFSASAGSRFLWDWQTVNVDNSCAGASNNGCGGHWALGYTHAFTATANSANGNDFRNGEYRTLPTATASYPISPAFTAGGGINDAYYAWNNADAGDTTFPLGTFYANNAVQSATPAALKGEIAMLDSGNTRYIRMTKTCSNNSAFNNVGRGLIAPDGRAFGFTSNYAICGTGLGRYDAFILVTP